MDQETLNLGLSPESLGKEAAAREAESLRSEINRHNHLYYIEARPEISDEAYDDLYRRLQALERAYPSLVTPDSPTQRVGTEPLSDLPTLAHAAPMLSLDSARTEEELRRFDERVRKAVAGRVDYLVEHCLAALDQKLDQQTEWPGRGGCHGECQDHSFGSPPAERGPSPRPILPFDSG